jgi:hypothetical protein
MSGTAHIGWFRPALAAGANFTYAERRTAWLNPGTFYWKVIGTPVGCSASPSGANANITIIDGTSWSITLAVLVCHHIDHGATNKKYKLKAAVTAGGTDGYDDTGEIYDESHLVYMGTQQHFPWNCIAAGVEMAGHTEHYVESCGNSPEHGDYYITEPSDGPASGNAEIAGPCGTCYPLEAEISAGGGGANGAECTACTFEVSVEEVA